MSQRLPLEQLWKVDFETLSEQIAREPGGSHYSEAAKAALNARALKKSMSGLVWATWSLAIATWALATANAVLVFWAS